MAFRITTVLSIIALAALFSPAQADNGKSNGKGNGNSASASSPGKSAKHNTVALASTTSVARGDKVNKGGLASELKGLNAVKANPNALEHASPNSQVGRIAAYRDAALITTEKEATVAEAAAALAAIPVPQRGIDAIDTEIAGLDPLAADYAETLVALEAERANALAYENALGVADAANQEWAAAQTAEEAALLVASGGRVLSDAAIAYVRDMLDL